MDFTLAGGGGDGRLAELSLAQDSAPLRELQTLAAAAGREQRVFERAAARKYQALLPVTLCAVNIETFVASSRKSKE